MKPPMILAVTSLLSIACGFAKASPVPVAHHLQPNAPRSITVSEVQTPPIIHSHRLAAARRTRFGFCLDPSSRCVSNLRPSAARQFSLWLDGSCVGSQRTSPMDQGPGHVGTREAGAHF